MDSIEMRAETKYTDDKAAEKAIRHLYDKCKVLAVSFRLTFMKEYTPTGSMHRAFKTHSVLLRHTDADRVLGRNSEGTDIIARHLRDIYEGLK